MAESFIVPTLIESPDGPLLKQGLLYKLPPDLSGSNKIASYLRKSKVGWHTIDHGYLIFIHKSDELGLLRFIGLCTAETRPTKNLGARHPFTKAEFENYVESLVERERSMRDRIREEIILLIHDLRRFSTSIYQNAVATKKAINEGNGDEASTRIENTLAAQVMLSVRTDILDMTESRDIPPENSLVPVYRKFDKVVRSFQPGCNLRGINLSMSGSSHSLVRGPECVEIIAYIIVDNALKYSPSNSEIKVAVAETDGEIKISVSSLGPVIEDFERNLIFNKGIRSKAATSIEASGTGYGLYLAKKLVNRFAGTLSVEQEKDNVSTSKGFCRDTTFFLSFPIAQKLTAPSYLTREIKAQREQLKARFRRPKIKVSDKSLEKNEVLSEGKTSESLKLRRNRRNWRRSAGKKNEN